MADGPPLSFRVAALRRLRRRWWLWLAAGLLIVLAWGLEAATRFDPAALAPAPGPLVLDRDGQILRLGLEAQGRKLIALPAAELPEKVAAAFIAAEDQRFWRHPGVDPLAVLRALAGNLSAGRIVSGASTITMQLARLTFTKNTKNPEPRTYWRKVVEMGRSLRMEWSLSKSQILRCYLDRVPMGNNLMGVETAARLYFGKPAAQLTNGEAALLAALARAPGTLNPYAPHLDRLLQRRERLLQRLAQLGRLSPEEEAAAAAEPVMLQKARTRTPRFPFEAPHFTTFILSRGAPAPTGGPIHTSLDLELQHRVEAIVASHRAALMKCGASQAAAVIVDNRSLELLALVGSFRYGPRDAGCNNGAAAWRSPGSALKPFLYALALDQGFTAASILEDVERRYQTPRGEFSPANFDRQTNGPISFREALANSLNLPTVSLLSLIEPQTYYDTLTRLHLINHPEHGPDYYGLGLVVGNLEVNLLQMAAAYACLANGGLYQPLRLQTADPASQPPVRIFSPQAAYIINDILSDPMARFRIFGASSAMNPPYRLAIKTGTSSHYRDSWAVGYNPEYTLAVWVGNFDGHSTLKLSGAAAAAPILADLAAALFQGRPPQPFVRPAGVIEAEICHFSGMKPGPDCHHVRRELFIAGTEPTALCTYHRPQQPWHQIPTPFAGWLHQRLEQGGVGRFRLANLDFDLPRLFQGQAMPGQGITISPTPKGKVTLGARRDRPLMPDSQESPLTITYPLDGDRFLLEPPAELLAIPLKAVSREPLKSLTCFVDGMEAATLGPPYETTLDLGRGHHHLLVVGPIGLGAAVEVQIQ
jgi:penicillin-binding protein 1C